MSDQNSDQVRAGWVEFLERFEFNTWGTITFREPRFSARGALRAAIYAVRKVCPRVQSGRTAAFVVAEQHESGAWHVHLLMRVDVEDLGLLCRGLWQFCFKHFGRSRFEVIRDEAAVRGYVAKYLLKGRDEVEWRLIGRPGAGAVRLRPGESVGMGAAPAAPRS